MRRSTRKWVLVAVAVIAILLLAFEAHRARAEILYGRSLLFQSLRNNTPMKSVYTGSRLTTNSSTVAEKKRILLYTPVGCTFDEAACLYQSGCSQTVKICDKSSPFTTCGIRLGSDYLYDQLPAKNKEILDHMCRSNFADSYDVFVKVDDDVLFRPEQIRKLLGAAEMAPRSLMGFLQQTKDGIMWPTGAIYIYTAGVLRELCRNETLRKMVSWSKAEDVQMGKALNAMGQVTYYNLDGLADVHHLHYHSSRVYVQFLQYGACSK